MWITGADMGNSTILISSNPVFQYLRTSTLTGRATDTLTSSLEPTTGPLVRTVEPPFGETTVNRCDSMGK